MSEFLFTSESVSEGHPDKVCDRISDAVVDLYLAADPFARVACETLVTTNHIVLAGEVRGPESVTRDAIEATARRAKSERRGDRHFAAAWVEWPRITGRAGPSAKASEGRESMNEPKGACYAGSFDPLTLGHLDLIRRAHALFPRLLVAIGHNASKQPLLSAEDRKALIEAEVADLEGVEVVIFDGLVVDLCRRHDRDVLVRGVRTASDFEAEMQMALTNRDLAPDVETVFVMPSLQLSYVSSRLIKETVRLGADVSHLIPAFVQERLRERLHRS